MPGCLYRLTFPSGRCYVGITSRDMAWRLRVHAREAANEKRTNPVARAIRKHGIASVTVQVLAVCDDRAWLQEMEKAAIVAFGTRAPDGYNATAGGDGFGGFPPEARELGQRRSIETRRQRLADPAVRAEWCRQRSEAWTDEKKAARAAKVRALWEGDYGERMRAKNAARPAKPKRPLLDKNERSDRAAAAWTPEKKAAHAERIRAAASLRRDDLVEKQRAVMADDGRRLQLARKNSPWADRTFVKRRRPARGAFLRAIWDQIPETASFDDLFAIGFRGHALARAVANGNLGVADGREARTGEGGEATPASG